MANPPPSPRHRQRAVRSQTDRLSILSDELLITIISLLPTRLAARTSLLCRRFQHLWKTCPSVYLSEDRTIDTTTFEAMATCAIIRRQSSNPLVSLRLNYAFHLPYTFLCSLLVKAHFLGLQHLIIDGAGDDIESIMPAIFSIGTLLFLQLPAVTPGTLPSVVTLTILKTLSLCLYDADSAEFNRLLAQLPSLEELRLMLVFTEWFTLSSQTIRKLDLCLLDTPPQLEFVGLSMPLLEMFHFNGTLHANVPRIEGDMPSLIKAVIILDGLSKKDSTTVAQLLNCVSNVEELSLNITESSGGDPRLCELRVDRGFLHARLASGGPRKDQAAVELLLFVSRAWTRRNRERRCTCEPRQDLPSHDPSCFREPRKDRTEEEVV
ncbi:hypothetical protein LUZ61_013326 [Rhynchospora tenuis]|uniref:F-box domain-containing protein n=1 Tax=Rhynchospora tenuis TaxID=198213 RepID=A0AAD5W8K3_9POAL|nr:hypothetical protein LUZ61_013326 [Rhynchospora tenuis]